MENGRVIRKKESACKPLPQEKQRRRGKGHAPTQYPCGESAGASLVTSSGDSRAHVPCPPWRIRISSEGRGSSGAALGGRGGQAKKSPIPSKARHRSDTVVGIENLASYSPTEYSSPGLHRVCRPWFGTPNQALLIAALAQGRRTSWLPSWEPRGEAQRELECSTTTSAQPFFSVPSPGTLGDIEAGAAMGEGKGYLRS